MAKKENIHYVNNSEFSDAIVEYVKLVREAKEKNQPIPIVPDYIAMCFLKIAERLSHRDNFIRYTYREEMVMDAVENCLRAVENYNIDAPTRTGKPNAFGYFTQISWYAFLRRIEKERKQQDVKLRYIAESGIETFIDGEDMDNPVVNSFIDQLKGRIDEVKIKDAKIKEFKKKERKKKEVKVDSDLTGFF